MDDKATLTKRLNGLAEVLTETTNFSSYAHTVYEASAELDLQAKQIAMLREALECLFGCDMEHVLMGDGKPDQVEAIAKAKAALAATAADVEAWEKQRRSEIIAECQQAIYNHPSVESEYHANDLCAALEPLKG
ncbi:MAG: hypothetical protein ACK52I_06625 [Pseudomonadota bacterium]|jgi:hypothetical protein